MALEKVGANPKDFVLVSIGGQQIQQLISLESGYVDAAVLSPPVTLGAQKKGFNKVLDIGALVEMPGGGLTTLAKTIQERPGGDQTCDPVAASWPRKRFADRSQEALD